MKIKQALKEETVKAVEFAKEMLQRRFKNRKIDMDEPALSLAKIPWEKWVKWILPLIGLQYLGGAIVVIIAQLIHLGPF